MRRWQSQRVARDLQQAVNGAVKAQNEPLLADLYIEDALKAVKPALPKLHQGLIDQALQVKKQQRGF